MTLPPWASTFLGSEVGTSRTHWPEAGSSRGGGGGREGAKGRGKDILWTLGRGRSGKFPDGNPDSLCPGPTAPLSRIKIALPLPFSHHPLTPQLPGVLSDTSAPGPIPDGKYPLARPSIPKGRPPPSLKKCGSRLNSLLMCPSRCSG